MRRRTEEARLPTGRSALQRGCSRMRNADTLSRKREASTPRACIYANSCLTANRVDLAVHARRMPCGNALLDDLALNTALLQQSHAHPSNVHARGCSWDRSDADTRKAVRHAVYLPKWRANVLLTAIVWYWREQAAYAEREAKAESDTEQFVWSSLSIQSDTESLSLE